MKALQIFVKDIENLKMAGCFHALRWLNLTYEEGSIPLHPLLEALGTLPNLQILHIFESSDEEDLVPVDPTIPNVTLPELRVLFMQNSPILNHVDASKLSYFDVCVSEVEKDYSHFCGFDFSRITHIQFDRNSPFIMGTSKGSEDIHRELAVGSIFDEPFTSYPNQFHVSFPDGTVVPGDATASPFAACLERATNLVEIILKTFDPESDYDDTFYDALIGATAVCRLTILSGQSLETICVWLKDGTICPNLERLSYSRGKFSDESRSADHLQYCLAVLLRNRPIRGPKPLEIEINGFQSLQHEALRRIQKMGGRVIQTKRNKSQRS